MRTHCCCCRMRRRILNGNTLRLHAFINPHMFSNQNSLKSTDIVVGKALYKPTIEFIPFDKSWWCLPRRRDIYAVRFKCLHMFPLNISQKPMMVKQFACIEIWDSDFLHTTLLVVTLHTAISPMAICFQDEHHKTGFEWELWKFYQPLNN